VRKELPQMRKELPVEGESFSEVRMELPQMRKELPEHFLLSKAIFPILKVPLFILHYYI
jgi:hypothetical protein